MSKSIRNLETRFLFLENGFLANVGARAGFVLAVCVFGAFVVTFLHSPAFMRYVWPDSGTHLYIGQRIWEGGIVYVDVFDNKPPLIYWLNAFAVGIAGRWGVWTISFIAVASAAWLSARLLTRAFGAAIALVVTTMWLLAYFQLINDGDMTEEFTLPLQFACLYLAWLSETTHQGKYGWRGFWIGVFVGFIFFLKANAFGVGIAIGLYILLHALAKRDGRGALKNFAPMVGGGILVAALVLAVLFWQGALTGFFDVILHYNFIYAQFFPLWEGSRDALIAGFNYLALSGLGIFGLVGFGLGVVLLLVARAKLPSAWVPLFGICALALPLEILLVTTTRRNFDHYFVVLFYVLAVWTGFLLWLARHALFTLAAPGTPRLRDQLTLGFLCAFGVLFLPILYHDYVFARGLRALEPPPVIEYIRAHTTPQDTVLMLGFEPRVLYFAERRAPTRFLHTIPLQFPEYATAAVVENYFAEILEKRPALIVDTRGYGLNNFTLSDSPKIQRQINRLRKEYRSIGAIGEWTVYERVPQ